MKKIYTQSVPVKNRRAGAILVLLLSFSIPTFSQGKFEFGFILKGGNYAMPRREVLPAFNNSNGISQITVTQKAGEIYSLGIWHSWALNNRFRLSSEVLYQVLQFEDKLHRKSAHLSGSTVVNSTFVLFNKIIGKSLAVPIKLHYFFRKNGKMSLSFGAGVTHITSANISRSSKTQFHGFPADSDSYFKKFSKWNDFTTTFNLNSGIHYRFAPKTSLGIEYSFERSNNNDLKNSMSNSGCDCRCYCDGFYFRYRPNMNSFSVSLRHNILH